MFKRGLTPAIPFKTPMSDETTSGRRDIVTSFLYTISITSIILPDDGTRD